MTNLQFATLLVGFVTLLLAVIGSSAWLNQRGLEKQMEAYRGEINAKLDAQTVKFNALDEKIALSQRVLESKLDALAERVANIERQLTQIFKPVLPR